MLLVSDVHDNPKALEKLVGMGEEVVILGDLVNINDYRTGRGAVAEVLGHDFAVRSGEARARGDYVGMRDMWSSIGNRGVDVRREMGLALERQYREAGRALDGGHGLVIHGNVDRPQMLTETLPDTFEYVHGKTVERNGLTIGFIGGGVETPLNAAGEISDELMTQMLEEMGPVDVLCTHVPPGLAALRRDVVTGKIERGSDPVYRYIEGNQPRYHFFGDVHQPQATRWRIGRTVCMNAGYFRATGRFLKFEDGVVQPGAIG